jgi:NAD(P)-dependent dehydrogenase (short-subunit alcohol dehydrogenase family)
MDVEKVTAPHRAVAIVTGAGTGIGRAVAVGLLRAGYRVALAGRRAELLASAAAEGDPAGDRSLAVSTDVTRIASVQALFRKVHEQFGRLDLLFNNAGIGARATRLEELPMRDWQAVLDVNVTGTFLCMQEAFRIMKVQRPRGGRIINNGSLSAQSPRPEAAAYTAAKHAISGLTKAASLEGRDYDIACGQIDIGNAATEMTRDMATGVLQANGSIAAEPKMDLAHVVDAVLFMASLPLQSNVLFLTIMATRMPFVGRG